MQWFVFTKFALCAGGRHTSTTHGRNRRKKEKEKGSQPCQKTPICRREMKHFAKSCSLCKYFHKLCLCACSCDVNKSGESREPGLERSRSKRLVSFFIIGIQRAADMTHKHARSGDSSPLGDIFPGLKMQKHIDSAGQQMTPAGERAHSAGPQRARQTLPSGFSGELIINSAGSG